MRRSREYLVLLGMGVMISGCSDSTDNSDLPDLTGSWNPTELSITNASDPSETADLIAAGITLKLVFQASNSYLTITTAPGDVPDSNGGTYTQTASTLVLTDSSSSADVTSFGLSVSGSTMILTDGNLDFDFGSGEVPALLDGTFHKQ